jgi:hypothetical protein
MKKWIAITAAIGALATASLLCNAALAALPGGDAERYDNKAFDQDRLELVTEERFPFAADGTVDVESGRGSITVTGWDKPEVQLVATRTLNENRGFIGLITGGRISKERALELLEGVAVETTASDDALRVRAHFDSNYTEPEVGLRLELRVPRATYLKLSARNGQVSVNDIDASMDVATHNGALEIKDVAGPVRARTVNGHLRLAAVRGDISAETGNGAIECLQAEGAVSLETTNGSIETTGTQGGLLTCRTTNGHIAVTLDRDSARTVDLRTVRGSVDCALPLDAPTDTQDNLLCATVRGGGPMVALQTVNGSISLDEE